MSNGITTAGTDLVPGRRRSDDETAAILVTRAIIDWLSDEMEKAENEIATIERDDDVVRRVTARVNKLEALNSAVALLGRMPLARITPVIAAIRQIAPTERQAG